MKTPFEFLSVFTFLAMYGPLFDTFIEGLTSLSTGTPLLIYALYASDF